MTGLSGAAELSMHLLVRTSFPLSLVGTHGLYSWNMAQASALCWPCRLSALHEPPPFLSSSTDGFGDRPYESDT